MGRMDAKAREPRGGDADGWAAPADPSVGVRMGVDMGDDVGMAARDGVDLEHSPRLPSWYRGLPPWLRRWAPPLTLAGLTLSLLLHIGFLVLAAIWLVGGGGGGGGTAGAQAGGGGVVGVAVMTDEELGQLAGGAVAEEAAMLAEAPVASAMLATSDLPVEVASLGAGAVTPGGVGEGLTGGAGAGAGEGGGEGVGTGGGSGGGAARFFGVEARGNRFAYVCDVSGSMSIGVGADGQTARIDVLKGELLRSILALEERSSFAVALFSSESAFLGGRSEWVTSGQVGKSWARRAVAAIGPGGDTQPRPAFELVFKLRPRPDAIYFMTDGEFDESNVEAILALNEKAKIPIHCITVISSQGAEQMRRIAEASGGKYTHFAGPSP